MPQDLSLFELVETGKLRTVLEDEFGDHMADEIMDIIMDHLGV